MPFRFDTEEELTDQHTAVASHSTTRNDTEIALGTRSLLAIFFGLVLVCSIFFGLGYSVGRAGGSRIAAATPEGNSPANGPHPSKPSADQGLTPVQTPPPTSEGGLPPVPQPGPTGAPSGDSPGPPQTPSSTAQNPGGPSTGQPAPSKPAVLQPASATSPSGFMVQVAAVRVQQDAEILVEALKKHGYSATVRNEPQDQLMHVQLGPFQSRADAIAMRTKLLSDGYNAVVK
jgi:DedD protein